MAEIDAENIGRLFEDFQRKKNEQEFTGEALLSHINLSTQNEMCSIRIAARMCEMGLFEEISKKRRSFLDTISRPTFSPNKLYRARRLDKNENSPRKDLFRSISEVTPPSPFSITMEGSKM